MKFTEEGHVEVSEVFSSGFDSPNVKPPLEGLLSVLEDPVPNTIPPLDPNLNPGPAAGWSDFFSTFKAAPNLKPSDELPNLNPDEAALSLEELSGVEVPNGTPNLNPLVEELACMNDPPNFIPDVDSSGMSDVPNLKPPEVEVEEPRVVSPAGVPKEEEKALGSTLAPGLFD